MSSLQENPRNSHRQYYQVQQHPRNIGSASQQAPMSSYQTTIYSPAVPQGQAPPRMPQYQPIPLSQNAMPYVPMGAQRGAHHVFPTFSNVSSPGSFSLPPGNRLQAVYFQPPMTQGMSYPHQLQPTGSLDQFTLQQQPQKHQQHQQHQQVQANHVPYSSPQQQSHTSKSERPKSKIVIRDPNQGGKDITNEILNRNKTSPPTAATAAAATAAAATITPATASTTTVSDFQPTRHDLAIREVFMTQVSERKNNNKPIAKSEDGKEIESQEGRNEVNGMEIPIQSNEEKIDPDICEYKDSQENVREESPATQEEFSVPDKDDKPLDNTEILHGTNVDENTPSESAAASVEEPDGDVSSSIKSEDAIISDELNTKHAEDNEQTIDVAPQGNEEEKESCQEAASLEVEVKSEPIVLNNTEEKCDSTQEGNVETQDSEGSTLEASQNDKIKEDDVNTSSISNDLEKPAQNTSTQVQKKKKKGQYKDRDSDMMSAFVDKPENKETDVTPEESVEPEQIEEDQVKEETWEDKDSTVENEPPKSERICYDRTFLLGFQYSSTKPSGLPNIEPVLVDPHEPTKPLDRGRLHSSGMGGDFMPAFMQKGSNGRQVGMSRSGKGGRGPAVKKIIPSNFEAKVELKKSDNAWVRPSEVSKDVASEESEKEELLRKARGILNKLTPQKFEKLVEMMKSLNINTGDKLKGVIDLIFEKALLEPSFSKAYARLCDSLAKQKLQIDNGSNFTFKRMLLNKCQKEFEKEKTDEQQLEKEQDKHFENAEEEKAWQEELSLRRYLTKKRSLGNIRFIGELFKLKMLTEAIMHACLCKLLKDRDEESLECLCQLLTTIGKDIDHEKAKPRTDQYFTQIEKIINQKKVSSRIIFMLKDVKDLRATKWVSRRISDAPKTIAEIHEEAKQEELQMQLAHQQAAQKRNLNKGGRDSPSLGRAMQNDDGWNQVPSKGSRSSQTVDPSRLKFTKRTDSENISLGPGGRPGAWAQGASGGGSTRFQLPGEPEPRQQGNRFSALSGGESGHRREGKGSLNLRGQQNSRYGRSSGMAGSGKRQQNQRSDEKAAVIESVRRMLSSEGNQSPSPPLPGDEYGTEDAANTTMESNDAVMSSGAAETDNAEKNVADEVSDEKVKNEIKMTIEEFLVNRDLNEAEVCIKELNCSSKHHIMVSEAINIAIEKKPEQGARIGELLHKFVGSGLVSLDSFKLGLDEILEFAEDIAVDIPHIWTNLGSMLGPAVVGETLPLSDLKTLVEPLIKCNKAGLLMAETLAAAAKISSQPNVGKLWQKSGLQWKNILPEDSNLQAFISKHRVEFTTGTIKDGLRSIIEDPDSTVEFIIRWIKDNVPAEQEQSLAFVRDLASAIFYGGIIKESPSFDAAIINRLKPLLRKYISCDKRRELEVLFAAQHLADELKHPKDFLRTIFEALYDEEVVGEECIQIWMDDKTELTGKGNALTSVHGFLDWLNEGHDENKR